ncbi:MAG: PilZ domain-containing protein [Bacilli bacterium]
MEERELNSEQSFDWDVSEKRRFVRAQYPCKIVVHFPKELLICTHTENIGAGGLRVIIEECLEVITTVDLEIYLQEEPILCKGRVVWVVEKNSAYRDGYTFFDTGIEFSQIREEDRNIINSFVERIACQQNDYRND